MADFSLIETMLWEKGEYFLLDLHLERLEKSARDFSFSYNEKSLRTALRGVPPAFRPVKKYRVRLLLDKNGKFSISQKTLENLGEKAAKVTFSDKKTDKNNIYLYHKTTNRSLYDIELERVRKLGFFDCLFLNQDLEVTEGAITNIIVEKDKLFYTPPVSSGVLAGVYRQYLFKEGRIPLKEKVLYKNDVLNADKLYAVNSVRKMVEVKIQSSL